MGTKKSERLAQKREQLRYHDSSQYEYHQFTAPFLQKTFELISSCDTSIASWEEDGESFIVKNTHVFARDYIPEYFEHNKFQSFSRQLNFYGFKKLPTKIIRLEDTDVGKSVRFYNPFFKRGRPDLLYRISRSTTTKKGNQEIEALKDRIHALEQTFDITHQKLRDMQNHLRIFVNRNTQSTKHEARPTFFFSQKQYRRRAQDDNLASRRQRSQDFLVLEDDFEPIKLDFAQ